VQGGGGGRHLDRSRDDFMADVVAVQGAEDEVGFVYHAGFVS
jgi:hypothetical protein